MFGIHSFTIILYSIFSVKQHIAKIYCPVHYDVPIVSSCTFKKNHYLLQLQVEQQSTVEWDRFSCQNVR